MKRIATLLAFSLLLLATTAQAQVTVDGVLDDAEYESIAMKEDASDNSFGETDVTEILYTVEASNDGDSSNDVLYLGIVGQLPTGGDNAIGFYLNFSELAGATAGTSLGGVNGAGSYMNNGDSNDDGNPENDFAADFEVDYMFAINSGGTDNTVFFNVVKQAGTQAADYLGSANQSGTSTTGPSDGNDEDGNPAFFSTGSITYAFNNDGAENTGLEVAFPLDELGVTRVGDFQAFAFAVSSSGFFSNETVPGNISGTSQPGFNANFNVQDVNGDNTADEGPFNSALVSLPVELSDFQVQADGADAASLAWVTQSETNNLGFTVQHRRDEASTWEEGGFVPSRVQSGTTGEAQYYTHRVGGLSPGTHVFELLQQDIDGDVTSVGLRRVEIAPEGRFHLSKVHPNPLAPGATAKMQLTLQRTQRVTATLHDARGRQVARLHDGPLAGASHEIEVRAEGLASGLYLVRIEGEDFSATRAVTLVR